MLFDFLFYKALLPASGDGAPFLYKVVSNPANIAVQPTINLGFGDMTLCSSEAYPQDELVGFFAYKTGSNPAIVDLQTGMVEVDTGCKAVMDSDGAPLAVWFDDASAEIGGLSPGIYIPDTICKSGLFVMTWLA